MKKNKICLFLTFIIIIASSIFLFNYGNDFYWHLKVGEYMINNHTIPKDGIFSWYALNNGLIWISHEWLFEIIIYLFQILFSNYGSFVYVLIMMSMIAIMIWKLNAEKFLEKPFYTIGWALCGTLIFANKTLPRPHLFSFLFFTITIYFAKNILQNPKSKLIYIAPIISILWSNIHGGSSNLSYIIYFIFFLYSLIIKKQKKQSIKFLYACVFSLLSIIVNPHGLKMIIYPYINMTYTTMINCIGEWKNLNFFSIDGFFYTLFIISIIYTIIKNKNRINILDCVLLIIFTILGIKATRFMPYLFIISSSIIPNYWNKSRIKINILPILSFVSIIFITINIYLVRHINQNFHKISNEMINYLKAEDNMILYNSYNLGGYLIYQGIPVFVDGRADMYIDSILSDVCQIEKGRNSSILKNYSFNTFLVENTSGAYIYLKNNSEYQLLLQDKNNSLFLLNTLVSDNETSK